MKTIFRFLLAILILALCFAAVIGACWLLGLAAHAVGLGLMSELDTDTDFVSLSMDGIAVICILGLALILLAFIVQIADCFK